MSDPIKIDLSSKKKIGLVCSGGAAKAGAFHLGVALALQEKQFSFLGGTTHDEVKAHPDAQKSRQISTYVGSSAGSIICSYLAAGYSLDNIFNSYLDRAPVSEFDMVPKVLPRLTYSKLFKFRAKILKEQIKQFSSLQKNITNLIRGNFDALFDLSWFRSTGLFSTDGIEQYLANEVLISNDFKDYHPDLFIVASRLDRPIKAVFGKTSNLKSAYDPSCEYLDCVPISKAAAASIALPPVFSPYALDCGQGEEFFIDGEIRDTLSSHVAIDNGCDLVFSSYTHQPYHFLPEYGTLNDHGLPAILVQSIYLMVEQKIMNWKRSHDRRKNAILAVDRLCQDEGLETSLRKKIISTLESELEHRLNVDIIYFHPNPEANEIYFKEHFNLNGEKMGEIVRYGFKSAISTLEKYEFIH